MCIPIFIAVLSVVNQDKIVKFPTLDKWIKLWCIYTHNEALSKVKMQFATPRMKLESIMLSEVSVID